MRGIGWLHTNEQVSVPPDTFSHALIGPAAPAALDVPSGAAIVCLNGLTSGGAAFNFWANFGSTKAQAPTSSVTAGSTGSTDANIPIMSGSNGVYLQIPGGTAGTTVISLACLSSGYVTAQWWKRT